MEVIALMNVYSELEGVNVLTKGRAYTVLERVDKEYGIMNDVGKKVFYPRIAFEDQRLLCDEVFTQSITEVDGSLNNGGKTDYYKLDPSWKMAQDIIEGRGMNFSQGNILKAALTFNLGRHGGTDYKRDLNKIIFFAKRELGRISKTNNK